MKAKYFLLGLLASVALPIPCAYAELIDTIIFSFGNSNTGPNVTGTQIGNTTTITATSVGAATPSFTPGQFIQDYTGSFSITGANGFNYLSATFSEPLWAIDASANWNDLNQAQISQMWGYTGSWSFTSDVSGLASTLNEDDQQIYFLGIFDATSFGITDGTIGSFTGNVTGAFASTGPAMAPPAIAAPEPSTWAMMLLGFVGLGYAGLRKARAAPASV